MKLLMLCDQQSTYYNGIDLQREITDAVQDLGWEVKLIHLNFDEINPCMGCFGCWVKTPGRCVIKKDCANDTAREVALSDAVILLSRVTYGGYSPDIKAMIDRIIQNVLPYFELIDGEMHHVKRYSHTFKLISFGYGDTTEAEAATFAKLTHRNAINFHSKKHTSIILQSESGLRQELANLQSFLKEEGFA